MPLYNMIYSGRADSCFSNVTTWQVRLYTLPNMVTSTGVDIYIQWDIVETTTAVCIFLGYTCVLFIIILKSVCILKNTFIKICITVEQTCAY